tara:strand:- start:2117 stop:2701 length:585 start_codon:yes stop_codon:yes gene_type:complete
MTKSIDFYFDFISPYSYLSLERLKLLKKNNDIVINYKPILLGGLHKLGGITPPAFNDRKLKNMKNDCELIAKKNNIKFYWNSKFPINSLYIMRGYLVIKDKVKENYFDNCFNAYWRDNIDISNENNVEMILEKTGIIKNEFFEKINQIEIKNKLKEFTDKAFEKDVFGAPTFVVNNKIFWGQDRLEYAIDELNS